MARQIIVLETSAADGGYVSCKVVFWFAIAAARAVPKPTFQSAVDAVLAGNQAVSTPELTALQNGTLLEEVSWHRFASSYTAAQIKAELVTAYQARQAYVASLPNPIAYYGVSYDGAAWSA